MTESLPGGNTASYTTDLTCDNDVVPGADGSFTITADLADTVVTCTFTNTVVEVAGEQAGSHPHSQQGSQPAGPATPPVPVPTTVDSGLAGTPGATASDHEVWPWLVLVAGGLLTGLTLMRTRRRKAN